MAAEHIFTIRPGSRTCAALALVFSALCPVAASAQSAAGASPPYAATVQSAAAPRDIDFATLEVVRPPDMSLLASRDTRDGETAELSCIIAYTGRLRACSVIRVSPADSDFGERLIRVAQAAQVRPRIVNGQPVDGDRTRIPFRGRVVTGDEPEFDRRNRRTAFNLLYAAAPSRSDVAMARPSGRTGVVYLLCRVADDAALVDCRSAPANEADQTMTAAALTLTPRFRVASMRANGWSAAGQLTMLVVRFESPDAATPTPVWRETPEGSAIAFALLPLATPAPERTVTAAINCEIGTAGELRDCRVVRESVPGVGTAFAGVAQAGFRANVWNQVGQSLIGVRVTVPIRYAAD